MMKIIQQDIETILNISLNKCYNQTIILNKEIHIIKSKTSTTNCQNEAKEIIEELSKFYDYFDYKCSENKIVIVLK